MIRIHHLPRSRSLRIIWQCEEMGLPYEIAPVTFPIGPDYLKLNPMGALPYMEDTANGVGMNESVAMMLYIAEQYGPTPLMPHKGDPLLAKTLQFLLFGEATLGSYGNVQVGAKFRAPPEHKANWSVEYSRKAMMKGFDFAASALGDKPYMAGDAFTLADISMGYTIGVARSPMMECGPDMPPALLAYHDRLTQRPAFQRAVAK